MRTTENMRHCLLLVIAAGVFIIFCAGLAQTDGVAPVTTIIEA